MADISVWATPNNNKIMFSFFQAQEFVCYVSMYVCMLMRFLKQKLKTNSSCIEQFLGLSDTHRDCVYIRYFYYLFSRKLPMFDLLDKN